MTSVLLRPLFLGPLVTPSGVGSYLDVNYNSGSTADVTLNSGGGFTGDLYWEYDSTVVGSLNRALKLDLEADFGGTWTVSFGSNYLLAIAYTGGDTIDNITFRAGSPLNAYDLGDSTTEGDAVLTFTANSWTGSFRPRWLWRPDEYLLDDQTIPQGAPVTAVSPFDGSSIVESYGEWKRRDLLLFATRGARVYQWAASDSGFATAAGVNAGEPHHHLERFWRDARTHANNGTPSNSKLVFDEDDWIAKSYTPVTFVWQDQDQLASLENVATVMSESPLQYTVRMSVRDTT